MLLQFIHQHSNAFDVALKIGDGVTFIVTLYMLFLTVFNKKEITGLVEYICSRFVVMFVDITLGLFTCDAPSARKFRQPQ